MAYHSKYSGAEVDAFLEKIEGMEDSLSTTNDSPIANKVVTAELNKKATTTSVESLDDRVTTEVGVLQTQLDSNGVLIEDLQENKADKEGYFPSMRVGLSDNLPDRGDVTEGSIGFRESAGAGNSIEDGTANVKELCGNSVVWNQLIIQVNKDIVIDNTSSSSILYQRIGTHGYVQDRNEHMMFSRCVVTGDLSGKIYYNDNIQSDIVGDYFLKANSSTPNGLLMAAVNAGTLANFNIKAQLIDLTQMFGAGNEPTSVEEFYSRIPQGVDLYAYNEGEVLGVNPTGIKSVNDNAWDEEFKGGYYDTKNGNHVSSSNWQCSVNPTIVLSNAEYSVTKNGSSFVALFYDANMNYISYYDIGTTGKFTTPISAKYLLFYTGTDTSKVCIRLAHSGYKTDYVPHEEDVMPLDLSAYFPNGMHGVNGVRDSVTPKKATQRFGVVDMGDLDWSYDSLEMRFVATSTFKPKTIGEGGNLFNLVSPRGYKTSYSPIATGDREDKTMCYYPSTNRIYLRDFAYSDATTFRNAIKGIPLYYELATPIETDIEPQLNLSYKVWDFGTEELLCDKPSAQIVAKTIYGFNATDTIRGNKSMIGEHEERIEDLEKEVVRVGDYQPDLSVGVADQLAGNDDATPRAFVMSQSGGGAILDGNARIESIKGNSIVWNQLLCRRVSNFTTGNLSVTYNNGKWTYNGSATNNSPLLPSGAWGKSVKGHKYIMLVVGNHTFPTIVCNLYNNDGNFLSSYQTNQIFESKHDSKDVEPIVTDVVSGQSYSGTLSFQLIDLTQMFGAGNEPSTIEEFYARIPQNIDLYAYNEGEVIHNNTDAIKSVGFNQWDEEWEVGTINQTNGSLQYSTDIIRSKNFIDVVGNQQYFIRFLQEEGKIKYAVVLYYDSEKRFIDGSPSMTQGTVITPSNARYIKFFIWSPNAAVTTYNNDICINLSDTSFNGTYEPYISREQSLDIIGKYFPNGMRSAGTAHDEIRYNKTTQKWEAVKRIGEVDLGTLSWVVNTIYGGFDAYLKGSQNSFRGVCAKYAFRGYYASVNDKESGYIYYNHVFIKDSSYTDAATFKSAMNGVMLYYELAEPIITEIEEDINLDYEVWNGGTEQAIADTPSTPLKADIVYGFNAYGVIKDLKAQLATMATQMAQMQLAMAQMVSTTSNEVE